MINAVVDILQAIVIVLLCIEVRRLDHKLRDRPVVTIVMDAGWSKSKEPR